MAARFYEAATSQARQAKVTGTVVQPNDALRLKPPQRLKASSSGIWPGLVSKEHSDPDGDLINQLRDRRRRRSCNIFFFFFFFFQLLDTNTPTLLLG